MVTVIYCHPVLSMAACELSVIIRMKAAKKASKLFGKYEGYLIRGHQFSINLKPSPNDMRNGIDEHVQQRGDFRD